MDRLDEFESMFKRAEREPFSFEEIEFKSIVLISDQDTEATIRLQQQVTSHFRRLSPDTHWTLISGHEFESVQELLEQVDEIDADMVITTRCLQESNLIPQHSLGVYLDVLTQISKPPILVLPGSPSRPISLESKECKEVMVMTDHISGDSRLINYGVRMCNDAGTVFLCHIEDDLVFDRYMTAIARIPEIETDRARAEIDEQLRRDAFDFIDSAISVLEEQKPELKYLAEVTRGHRIREYQSLIKAHEVDLLVANTKDDMQLAMHGMAYSLTVEIEQIPILLL